MFPSVHSEHYLNSVGAEKKILKKLDKENEGMNNVLFVGMTYIISLATTAWHSVQQSMLCHLGCLKSHCFLWKQRKEQHEKEF